MTNPFEFEKWPRGCLQVYTGNGKGKTTAAIGLAVRAAGRGLKTYIGQFMKGYEYGEIQALKSLEPYVTIQQFGSAQCIPKRDVPNPEDVELAQNGLSQCREVLQSGKFKIVILDEINVAHYFNLVSTDELLELVASRPSDVEVVCTGRYAPESLLKLADLITVMESTKHYFETEELPARDGIER